MRSKQSSRSSAVPQGGPDQRRAGRGRSSQPFLSAQRFLSSRWFRGEKLVWVGNLALLALLGYVLWSILPAIRGSDAMKPATARQSQAAKPKPAAETSGAASGAGPIFSAAGNRLSGDAVETPTQLPLRLLGTVAGDPSVARAIIEDAQAKAQNLYRVGESVAGARIEEIGRSSVVLLVSGRREILEMSFASTAEPTPSSEPPKVRMPSADKISDAIKSSSPHNFQINKPAILTALAAIGGYEAIFRKVGEQIKPYDDGTVKGLQINGLDDSMAAPLNLQNGDVIQSVNGQNLDSMQKAWQVWQKAHSQPDLDVQIMRGNSVVPLHFSLSGS